MQRINKTEKLLQSCTFYSTIIPVLGYIIAFSMQEGINKKQTNEKKHTCINLNKAIVMLEPCGQNILP